MTVPTAHDLAHDLAHDPARSTAHPAASPLPPVGRRTVLATTAALGAGVAAAATTEPWEAQAADPRSARYFAHGVASGDPLPDRVVLWTRVTPTATATPGSGRGPTVRVTWQVARDHRFRTRDLVRTGTFETGPSRDHTVKLDATGLEPGRWYYYRFLHRGVASPVGRTRTAPAADASLRRLRLGVVSCANLQAGWFSAYRHLAARTDLDAVVHLGDYFYEYAPGQYGMGPDDVDVRPHQPAKETVTLADYRVRHAQYKRDPDLARAHRRFPWIITWDDHEVTNDQWRSGAENHTESARVGQPAGGEGRFLNRRAHAHRAYDEWMPVRMNSTARLSDGDRLFRRFRFGQLAEISMLDLRSYRDEQVSMALTDPAVSDPDRTITGRQQMEWLKRGLTPDRPQWRIVGNPVMIAPVTFAQVPTALLDPVNDVTGLLPRDGAPYNVDQWDGYTDDRREVLEHIRDQGVRDVVFITGDIHSGWACDLPYDVATYPLGMSAGVEFVCASVTSNNLKDITGDPTGATSTLVETAIRGANRHIKYLDFDGHGYSVLDVTPERTQMDWYLISARDDRGATASWTTSFRTLAGTGTCQQVDGPVA